MFNFCEMKQYIATWGLNCSHLSLDAVKSSEPENLSSPQLPLCMVNLFIFLIYVLFW